MPQGRRYYKSQSAFQKSQRDIVVFTNFGALTCRPRWIQKPWKTVPKTYGLCFTVAKSIDVEDWLCDNSNRKVGQKINSVKLLLNLIDFERYFSWNHLVPHRIVMLKGHDLGQDKRSIWQDKHQNWALLNVTKYQLWFHLKSDRKLWSCWIWFLSRVNSKAQVVWSS